MKTKKTAYLRPEIEWITMLCEAGFASTSITGNSKPSDWEEGNNNWGNFEHQQ